MQIEYAKVSALGDRQDNQDRAAVVASESAALLLVFDGMGGHSDGAMAAELGLKVVQELFVAARQPIFDPQGCRRLQAAGDLRDLSDSGRRRILGAHRR
jgi:serine/threonine protein phosphatase PrpC